MAKKGLGKGLGSFFDNEDISEITAPKAEGSMEIAIIDVEPNPKQPRKVFDKDKIDALAASIREQGIIQPIVVCKQDSGRYTIVAGERRWRAAKKAGLKKIPAIVKEYTQEEVAKAALVENLQREDLNPIEEAQGYKSLLEEYKLTQEAIATITGKSRSAIANSTRLLSLEKEYQAMIEEGVLTGGHARALLSVDGERRKTLCEKIIKEGLNVRQAEAAAKKEEKPRKKAQKNSSSVAAFEIERLENELSLSLGTKVKIAHTSKKGKIQIEYFGNDDLDRIISLIKR